MKNKIDISLQCSNLNVEAVNFYNISVTLTDVEKSDILDNFNLEDIIEHFNKDEILDHIGEDEVKEYFGFDNE